MDRIFADLHNHTTASDGDLTPEELVAKAKSLGIKAIGVTNHDTVKGLKSAVDAGMKNDVDVVPGVEISIRFKEPHFVGTLHLLAYFRPERLDDEIFIKDMTGVLSRGRGDDLVRARVDEINRVFGPQGTMPALKRPLKFEDISALSANASRRHFALALQQSFGITNPAEINRIIGNDSPAYLPSGIDFDTAMDLAADQNLLSVLAHPAAGSFPGEGHYKEVLPPVETVETFFPKFLKKGLKGIEVYYPGHTVEHQELMLSWARRHDLLITGGSDTHDAVTRPPGKSGIDRETYEKFAAQLK